MSLPLELSEILIVDDMPANIKVLAEVLRRHFRIIAATNGEDAIKIAGNAHPPDLILLDIIMPQMDGYEVCARLKADPKTHRIPVIFITDLNSDEDETRGMACGAVDFITKPFSIPIVKARIQTHLRLSEFEKKQEKLIIELKQALTKVKTLNGLLPICSRCKKIRDDTGYWNQIETYISQHSLAEFSHSICPDCAKILYPDLD